jgi:hypothetical protein
MSGTKRHPIYRFSRNRPFSNQTLTLFAELERTPRRNRNAQVFKDKERELARMLNLVSEWWTGNSVLDDSSAPVHPEGYVARADWHRVRQIREALLAARAAETVA